MQKQPTLKGIITNKCKKKKIGTILDLYGLKICLQIKKPKFVSIEIFGLTCSQFLVNATVNNHIQKYIILDPDFVKKVQGTFHVDDLITGVYSVKYGIELCKKVKIRFQEVQFNLRKWHTNSYMNLLNSLM